MQKVNNNQKFVAIIIVLLFSMTIYHNIYFDKIFSYYEHNGEKDYDLDNDGWSVDLNYQYDSKADFDEMFSELDTRDYPANSVILVTNGLIVREEYYNDFSYNTEFNTYSVTKSFTSALVGIAIDQGLIGSVDDSIWDYFPNRTFENDSPNKQKVTIKHILMMTSGIDYGGDPTLAPTVEGSRAEYVLNRPVKYEPGTVWVYDSQAPSVLLRIIELQSNMTVNQYAEEYLFGPLQIQNPLWTEDESGLAFGGFGLYLAPREMAKLGQLYLQGGVWNDTRIVSEEWVNESTTNSLDPNIKFIYSTIPTGGYGYLWWIYEDFYVASGLHGQRVIVNPEQDYVLTFTSLDVTQSGANALHQLIIKGEADPWRKPMNEFYFRSLPYFALFLLTFSALNFSFLKYGLKSSIKDRNEDKDLFLTSFVSSFFVTFMSYLLTLSIIFAVLDIYFGNPRGFMLFPKFQLLTWATILAFTVSAALFEKEWLKHRHSADLSHMSKFIIPKAIVFITAVILLFFSIYLNMVAEYSA